MSDQIPLSSDTFYDQRVVLDGQEFVRNFTYNQRIDSWYLDILSEAEELLEAGIKLVTDFPLLRKRSNPALPPGELVVQRLSLDVSNVTLEVIENLRVALFYVTEEELEENG